jgi:hypothetical protein
MLAGRKGQPEQQQGVQQGGGGPEPEAARVKGDAMATDESHGQAQDLIAERLKMVAEQRVALAQAEIKKQEQHLQQMQEQLKELTKQGLPLGSLTDDIAQATQRLNESKADFSRANEAKQNIDLTRSLRQDSTDSSTEIGSEKVREKLGGPPGGTKLEGEGTAVNPRMPGHRR